MSSALKSTTCASKSDLIRFAQMPHPHQVFFYEGGCLMDWKMSCPRYKRPTLPEKNLISTGTPQGREDMKRQATARQEGHGANTVGQEVLFERSGPGLWKLISSALKVMRSASKYDLVRFASVPHPHQVFFYESGCLMD